MSASRVASHAVDFNPRELVNRAKKRRNFSEKFDSFSDAYVWVLAALVALAYLFSALFGMLFVLLGEGVAHQELPSAVWRMQDLSFVLLALAGLATLRLMLYLGPCGLSAAKADWWLPLPVALRAIRQPSWRNAVLTGLFTSSFAGALWLIVMLGLAGSLPLPVAVLGLACFAVAGVGLANAATAIQGMNQQIAARRICDWMGLGLLIALAMLWMLLMFRIPWSQSLVGALAAATLNPAAWTLAFFVVLAFSGASTYCAYRHFGQIPGQALRSAGEHQQFAMGTLMQGDSRGIAAPAQSAISRRRARGSKLTAKLPVAWRILCLRLLRGGRWHSVAWFLLLVFALAATVQRIANPLSAAAFYLALCVVLTLSISTTIAPLVSEQQLTQLLGISEARLVRAATLYAMLFSAITLLLLTGGLGMLGMISSWIAFGYGWPRAWSPRWGVLRQAVPTPAGKNVTGMHYSGEQPAIRPWPRIFSWKQPLSFGLLPRSRQFSAWC
ncbi:hypothetical protein [Glutamicibacter sp.]|uniref:hypothetical protein n=1 Tax=Glutamicibacter sp. TaxID=1931995 RepID=UPI003D6C0DA4